ncbi:hypothetical protein BJ912DRAFT_931921 [Pholiota molesta]|nr:hypothetical protein BJ912DRAFT_931921 [Pholiota molesta]
MREAVVVELGRWLGGCLALRGVFGGSETSGRRRGREGRQRWTQRAGCKGGSSACSATGEDAAGPSVQLQALGAANGDRGRLSSSSRWGGDHPTATRLCQVECFLSGEGAHRSHSRTSPHSLPLGSVVEFGAARRATWALGSAGALPGVARTNCTAALRELLWLAAGEGRGVFGAFADGVAACGGWLRRGRVVVCLARSRTGSRRVVAGSSHSRLHGGTPRGDLLWAEVGRCQKGARCQCQLLGLLTQYLQDAKAAGVDMDSDQRDLADVSDFDRSHLQGVFIEPNAPHAASLSVAPSHEEIFQGDSESSSRPKKRAKAYRLQAGEGESWRTSAFGGSIPPKTTPRPKQKQKHVRSKASKCPRGGAAIREAGGDTFLADTRRLLAKWIRKGDIFRTEAYTVLLNGKHVSTGWHGLNPSRRDRAEVRRDYLNGSIVDTVAMFFPVYADLLRPAILLDADSRIFLYRTTQFHWLTQAKGPFHQAVNKLLGDSLNSAKVRKANARGEREHHRQYATKPALTLWHRQNMDKANEFIKDPLIQKITEQVSGIVKLVFPGVAERFNKSAQWHQEVYGITPIFGLFWNLCINGLFPNQERIHCLPHADSKNIVGVCVLVIYEIPGKKFNHSKRSWLVLWEAGIAIQLPPWVIVAYPSALIYHFNLDITNFRFVTTEGDERPTPENSTPIEDGDDEGRGAWSILTRHPCIGLQKRIAGHSQRPDAKDILAR